MIYATALSMLSFFRSPLGRYLLIGVAAVCALWLLHHDGYVRGAKHEHLAMQKKLDVSDKNLKTCQGNATKLDGIIKRQNEALIEIQKYSDAKLAKSEKDAQRALRVAQEAQKSQSVILGKKLVGKDECERAREVDSAFLDELR